MRSTPDRRGFSRLLATVGLILVATTAGAFLPGSTVAQVPDSVLITGPAPGVTPDVGESDTTGSPTSGQALGPSAGTAPGGAPASPTSSPSVLADAPAGLRALTMPAEEQTTGAPVLPTIAPSPVTRLRVPAIGVDAQVLPVDSTPTGKKNAWGGPIYSTLEFPVDKAVRQWVRRGDPNTLPPGESAGNVKAFDRVLLYGHASDIGHHLVFQDLSALKAGDTVIATTALGTFTYRVTLVATRAKTNLDNLAALYDYPANGAKEIALVACLPNTTSNAVVIGTLATAVAAG